MDFDELHSAEDAMYALHDGWLIAGAGSSHCIGKIPNPLALPSQRCGTSES